ncbi:putative phosphatase regulatory subunit-domain-containing protein [Xylariales sp. PMI_506]|nr:putative phosphatase regulatory subunit-domain-containing protein [Xylariales sp. PMI_506]
MPEGQPDIVPSNCADPHDESDVALKDASSTSPITPILRRNSTSSRASKSVQFKTSLEHVRYFCRFDCPVTVNNSSPSDDAACSKPTNSPFEYHLQASRVSEHQALTPDHPVRLEQLRLGHDPPRLAGIVAVLNLQYQKSVAIRFSFDGWTTVSEVAAQYTSGSLPPLQAGQVDHFQFDLSLDDQSRLPDSILLLCVRYRVNGEDFWDNNKGQNFRVELPPNTLQSSSRSRARLKYDDQTTCRSYSYSPDDASRKTQLQLQSQPRHHKRASSFDSSLLPQNLGHAPRDSSGRSEHYMRSLYENRTIPAPILNGRLKGSKPAPGSPEYEELVRRYCFFQPNRPQNSTTELGY